MNYFQNLQICRGHPRQCKVQETSQQQGPNYLCSVFPLSFSMERDAITIYLALMWAYKNCEAGATENKNMFPVNCRKKSDLLSNSQIGLLFMLMCLCAQAWWQCVYYILYWNKMLSLPGGDVGNKKQQVAADAWGRQKPLLNAAEKKRQRWQNVILCLLHHQLPSPGARVRMRVLLLRTAGC